MNMYNIIAICLEYKSKLVSHSSGIISFVVPGDEFLFSTLLQFLFNRKIGVGLSCSTLSPGIDGSDGDSGGGDTHVFVPTVISVYL